MRKCSYDSLGLTLDNLKNRLANQKDALVKAMQEDSLEKVQAEVDEVGAICKSVYSQFTDLKNDFTSGKINLAWYKEYLSKLNNLLTGVDEKITCPNLHAEEIATELKRFF